MHATLALFTCHWNVKEDAWLTLAALNICPTLYEYYYFNMDLASAKSTTAVEWNYRQVLQVSEQISFSGRNLKNLPYYRSPASCVYNVNMMTCHVNSTKMDKQQVYYVRQRFFAT